MWRDAALVVGKDLRIEARSRVGLSQVAPFGIVALALFAFALGPDRAIMAKGAPGLFWVAVLFCTVLAVQRSVSVESADGARDGLRLSGIDKNGNGIPDEGDEFVHSVKVILDGKITQISEPQGAYFFGNVSPGKHVLTLDIKTLPIKYIPLIKLQNEVNVTEGTTYILHIPMKLK